MKHAQSYLFLFPVLFPGAHINPAVTIGLAFAGELSWLKVPIYIVVQMVGGVLGSLLAYCIYSGMKWLVLLLFSTEIGLPFVGCNIFSKFLRP
jgi:glycerol uptake facilitator-like aquaporin